jgi:predicted alpha/beta-hydrolase family hydrolase
MAGIQTITDGPERAEVTYLFAHGAGAGMDHPFMTRVAQLLGAAGIRVVRFEFPYMAARRHGGKRGAPDRTPVLLETWRQVIRDHPGDRVFIGGKSMGGRIATMVAEDTGVAGAVCFGYPFHPPGKPEQLRTAHLESIATPVLILQGERDPFGTRADVATYALSPSVRVEWVTDGDHSLAPRRGAGVSAAQNVQHAAGTAVSFMLGRP